jgi:uncharacterized repeat protein (TIGR03803 family)
MRFVIAKAIFLVAAFCLAAAIASSAQAFTSLFSFDGANGAYPQVGLVQGIHGGLYGSTQAGGSYNSGTIFEVTTGGELTTLHSFCSPTDCNDGYNPSPGLVLATDGNFYGMTMAGGAFGGGTVFKITPEGELTTLYAFCSQANCMDGATPQAGLVQADNGNFYGTTSSGGAGGIGTGTIFEITPQGKLTTLYNFLCTLGSCINGESPEGALLQATNGNFYGTTFGGGAHDAGTVFEITPTGKLTTLYGFCAQANCTDGAAPHAGLIQASNGYFYGTTEGNGCASLCGTVFKMTPTGKLISLYNFCECADGFYPAAALIQATDGNFYGTTENGGARGGGALFRITPEGKTTTLYTFCSQYNCDDGFQPSSSLLQATDGTLYGTTSSGGTGVACIEGCGTVYSFSIGLGPFVETLPTSGKVGAKVIILGNNLTGATSVSFNGTTATFTVVSDTEITATAPAAVTTGRVTVTTAGGALKSNVVFRVTE